MKMLRPLRRFAMASISCRGSSNEHARGRLRHAARLVRCPSAQGRKRRRVGEHDQTESSYAATVYAVASRIALGQCQRP